LNHLNPADRSI